MTITAGILPNGMTQFLDANGKPFVGGMVYFFVPGTTAPKTTWQDPEQTIPTTNPVILDSAGRALIYGNGQYRQVFRDSLGNTIWDRLTEWEKGIPPGGTTGQVLTKIDNTDYNVDWETIPVTGAAMTFRFDGAGSVPSTGVLGDLYLPFAATIDAWTLQADQTGNMVLDIWADAFVADTPPTVANTITGSSLPTLSSQQQQTQTFLTGWTTSLAAGTAVRFNLNSIATITRFTLTLSLTK